MGSRFYNDREKRELRAKAKRMTKSIKNYLSLVKFSHTIFALPFALMGFFLGVTKRASGSDTHWWKLFVLVLLCMVFARNSAMAFNRWLDQHIDALNPRTAIREIPAGIVPSKHALLFVIINVICFI